MRQHHVAGDKVFIDDSGRKIAIADPYTGLLREAEIFVGVLGASSYTYAEATWTQALPDWIGAHGRMFAFFGGVLRLIVPDNLKSGVRKASLYDPELNRSYAIMAAHYEAGILPAHPRQPKDKAGVRFAQSYILGRLRHPRFFPLEECNTAIRRAPLASVWHYLGTATGFRSEHRPVSNRKRCRASSEPAQLEAGTISGRTPLARPAAKARGVQIGGNQGNLPAVAHQRRESLQMNAANREQDPPWIGVEPCPIAN